MPQHVNGATCHVLDNELWVVSSSQALVLPLWNSPVAKWREVPLGGERGGIDATASVLNKQLHVFTSENSSFTHPGDDLSLLVLRRGVFRTSWGLGRL